MNFKVFQDAWNVHKQTASLGAGGRGEVLLLHLHKAHYICLDYVDKHASTKLSSSTRHWLVGPDFNSSTGCLHSKVDKDSCHSIDQCMFSLIATLQGHVSWDDPCERMAIWWQRSGICLKCFQSLEEGLWDQGKRWEYNKKLKNSNSSFRRADRTGHHASAESSLILEASKDHYSLNN